MKLLLTFFTILILSVNAYSQEFAIGVGGGASMGINESVDRPLGPMFRAYALQNIGSGFWGELGVSYLSNSGSNEWKYSDYKNTMIVPDLKLRYQLQLAENIFAFPYTGLGFNIYNVNEVPYNLSPESDSSGMALVIPAGLGFQFVLSTNWMVELHLQGNASFTDNLNPPHDDRNDGYWSGMLGIVYRFDDSENDSDGDGLTNAKELELGTDPKNPDTDGDGLKDGAEYYDYETDPKNPDTDGDGLKDGDEVNNYKTKPTVADTDGDGLKDGAEVKTHNTDPLNDDTDGDGLSDGDEVIKHKTNPLDKDSDKDDLTDGAEVNNYKTNPLKDDTDGDGLKDGNEVNSHKTDPLNTDTDNDGLKDGDEVIRYKTNPNDPDTDKGTVKDGKEVSEGKDPLNPKDDAPVKKLNLELGKGKQLVLEGINFETGSATINPSSDSVLTMVYQTMVDFPEIAVEISGHTDNVGRRDKNMKLSLDRAQSVKNWLVAKGVDANRMTVAGFGPDKPIAANDTPENKLKNRRIEFKRTK